MFRKDWHWRPRDQGFVGTRLKPRTLSPITQVIIYIKVPSEDS